jgi:hypothetical protein
MSAVSPAHSAQQDLPGLAVLWRLGALRWLTLLSFNLAYVAVPLLLFERTRSVALVGVALIAEGVLRAGLALGAGVWFRSLGAHRATALSCLLRLLALGLLAAAVMRFSVALVALASTLFYIGHFFATLEQELRSATLGRRAVGGQTAYRIGEVLAPPVALALAWFGTELHQEYGVLLATAALAVLAHGLAYVVWLGHERHPPQPPRADIGLAAGWNHLMRRGTLVRGLVASIVGFGFFGWAVLATPFALAGRELFTIALDSAAGIALFKAMAALIGVAAAVFWGALMARPRGPLVIAAATIVAPLLFALGITARADAQAVALLALVCALLLGLFTWQRRLRQLLCAPEHYPAVTTWCMALECLHICLIGVALIANAPWTLALCGTLLLALALRPAPAPPRP